MINPSIFLFPVKSFQTIHIRESYKQGLIQVFVVYSCIVESIWRYMSEKIVYYHHKANVTSNKTNATVIRTFSTDHKIPNDGDRCLLIISR